MTVIPKIINHIWFGSWEPKNTNAISHIKTWRNANPSYKIHLYSSQTSMPADEYHSMKTFCSKHDITLIDIDIIANPELASIKAILNNKPLGLPRFAAASDLLRVYALLTHGGHYFDLDIIPDEHSDLSTVHWECKEDCYQMQGLRSVFYEYCVMGSAPGSMLYKKTWLSYLSNQSEIVSIFNMLSQGDYTQPVISSAVLYATGQLLTLVARRENIVPEMMWRMENCSLDYSGSSSPVVTEIVEGKLAGKLQVSFERTYGDEDYTSYDSTEIARRVERLVNSLSTQSAIEHSAGTAITPGFSAATSSIERPPVKVYASSSNKKVSIAIKFDNEDSLRHFSSSFCSLLQAHRLDSQKLIQIRNNAAKKDYILYINPSLKKQSFGCYVTAKGEIALYCHHHEIQKFLVDQLTLDNALVAQKPESLYFKKSMICLDPRKKQSFETKYKP